jgi:hypothetical protein
MATRQSASRECIFLLGAGASVDAGMAMVRPLTEQLKHRLANIPDVHGNLRPEFRQIFDLIEAHDPSVAGNYERWFEWIRLLLDVQREPFRQIVAVRFDRPLREAMAHLPFVVGGEIARVFGSCQCDPGYLARLVDFIPAQGRLKVVSLNYDCCLEETCQSAGIGLTTGFDSMTKRWNPSFFRTEVPGINLYKLHGSLRWHGVRDKSLPDEQFQLRLRTKEAFVEGHIQSELKRLSL